jgi:hypothetical protein
VLAPCPVPAARPRATELPSVPAHPVLPFAMTTVAPSWRMRTAKSAAPAIGQTVYPALTGSVQPGSSGGGTEDLEQVLHEIRVAVGEPFGSDGRTGVDAVAPIRAQCVGDVVEVSQGLLVCQGPIFLRCGEGSFHPQEIGRGISRVASTSAIQASGIAVSVGVERADLRDASGGGIGDGGPLIGWCR